MDITKKAEALKEDLSLSKLLDVVIELCGIVEKNELDRKPVTPKETLAPKPEIKPEIKKKK